MEHEEKEAIHETLDKILKHMANCEFKMMYTQIEYLVQLVENDSQTECETRQVIAEYFETINTIRSNLEKTK